MLALVIGIIIGGTVVVLAVVLAVYWLLEDVKNSSRCPVEGCGNLKWAIRPACWKHEGRLDAPGDGGRAE